MPTKSAHRNEAKARNIGYKKRAICPEVLAKINFLVKNTLPKFVQSHRQKRFATIFNGSQRLGAHYIDCCLKPGLQVYELSLKAKAVLFSRFGNAAIFSGSFSSSSINLTASLLPDNINESTGFVIRISRYANRPSRLSAFKAAETCRFAKGALVKASVALCKTELSVHRRLIIASDVVLNDNLDGVNQWNYWEY